MRGKDRKLICSSNERKRKRDAFPWEEHGDEDFDCLSTALGVLVIGGIEMRWLQGEGINLGVPFACQKPTQGVPRPFPE